MTGKKSNFKSLKTKKKNATLDISESNDNQDDDEDGFGDYQTDDINPPEDYNENEKQQDSEESLPEDDETIAKEELRGLCDEEDE